MPISYSHLIRDQRSQIYALMSNGLAQKNIAAHLGVHPSTISRGLKRNTGGNGYRFGQADRLASARRHAASSAPKSMTPLVVKIIEDLKDFSLYLQNHIFDMVLRYT